MQIGPTALSVSFMEKVMVLLTPNQRLGQRRIWELTLSFALDQGGDCEKFVAMSEPPFCDFSDAAPYPIS